MDVRNLNDRNHVKNKLKNTMCNRKITQFSIETYFIWFSALIFVTELIVDLCLVTYYFHRNQTQWGWIMLAIIIVPLILCQIYSLCLLRSDVHIQATALLCHLFLLGVPYRYQNILRKLDKEKIAKTVSLEDIAERIHDVNSIQMLNAICQYFPQFLFQAFLIVYRKYKCVITGVSAGLAAFSFLWHIFVHFYFCFKCNQNDSYDQYDLNAGTRIIDNLSSTNNNDGNTSLSSNIQTSEMQSQQQPNSIITIASISTNSSNHHHHPQQSDTLTKKLKNFEKPLYNTDDKNFVSKKSASMHKNVEKNNIFSFNKRKPIYERDNFDFSATTNNDNNSAISGIIDSSTIFFEINDDSVSSANATAASATIIDSNSGKYYLSLTNENMMMMNGKDIDNFINENNLNLSKSFNKYNSCTRKKMVDYDDDVDMLKCNKLINGNNAAVGGTNAANNILQENRNTILKRKGICSSQEMLHLVDIMNDNITAEQVDILAKSLIELGGCCSGGGDPGGDDSIPYTDESEHNNSLLSTTGGGGGGDNVKLLLEQFPSIIDDRLLENIDAAIYENQIIFQERIRKNQLTIQNLKLQDQMLSKCMMMMSNSGGGNNAGGCGIINNNDDLLKSSSLLLPSTCTELLSIRDYENMCFTNISRPNYGMKHWRNYLNDIDANTHDNSTVQHSSFYVNTNTLTNSDLTDLYINEIENYVDADSTANNHKKTVRWQQQPDNINEHLSDIAIIDDDDDEVEEQLYTIADDATSSIREKNILVQTINKINVDSPLKNLLVNKPTCLNQYYDDDDEEDEKN